MSDIPSVPDYFGQFMAPLQRQQQIDINRQQVQAEEAQVYQRAAEQQAKLHQQQMFQSDAQSVISNPTPEGYRSLMLKYPSEHEGIKAAWDQQSEGQRQRDTEAASQVYAALSNGRSDLALSLLKDRQAALKNGGEDDKITDNIIDMISSGDPAKVKQAQGIAGFVLASAAGPDKIGSTLEALSGSKGGFTLDPGAIRYDANGNVVAESPYLQGKDGTLYQKDNGSGGGAPSSAPATAPNAPGGFENAVATVLKNEGGYAAKDMNGKPVNFGINQGANPDIKVKDLTKDQAIQLYHDRYWVPSGADKLPANLQTPYFDVYIRNPKFAKVALAKSGGDPAQFMQLAQSYFQNLATKPGNAKYAKPYANRDANNLAIATGQGGSPVAAPAANAPPGYRVLIPAGPAAPPSGYMDDPTKGPGGLMPRPGGPADKAATGDTASPQMLDDAATQFLVTGQMPALGNGGAALKEQILNRRSEIMKSLGISATDLPAFQSRYAGDKKALQDNSTLLSALESSEGALRANAQQVLLTQKPLVDNSIIDNGSPFLNSMRLKTYKQVGSSQTKASIKSYEDAVNAYATEYAKFMSSASGMSNAPSSDAARNLASELNDIGMGPSALGSHLKQSLVEAQNKKGAVAAQNQNLQQRLTSYLTPGAHPGLNQPSSPSSQGPKPGMVVRGYRFKGGNPADKNNWIKL